MMKGASVFSFKDGMETIVRAMEEVLTNNPKVSVLKNTGVESIVKDASKGEFAVKTSFGASIRASHLVSALPLPNLQTILDASPTVPPLPYLTANPSSSVSVVNIIFPPSPTPIHPPGFGYLVPRPQSKSQAEIEDHAGVLGTVFDSTALGAQDIYDGIPAWSYLTPKPEKRFTKLTMMLGGPHPLELPLSDEKLLAILTRHLAPVDANGSRTSLPEPVYMRQTRLEACIPTPTPGHLKRMEELREALEGEGWGGKLDVVGAGVGGVSVPECVEQGRKAGSGW